MTVTDTADQFTTLPDDETLAATVTALEEHGFSVEVVDTLAAARTAVLARIPAGSTVMTNTSVTLQETGIADASNDDGRYAWGAANVVFVVGQRGELVCGVGHGHGGSPSGCLSCFDILKRTLPRLVFRP